MNKEKKITYGFNDLDRVVLQLLKYLDKCQIMTFAGPLGTGKTTIIRALLRHCGITQPITSPTYTYMNIYENMQQQTFYHFDLYRIKNLDNFIVGGFDEYLYKPDSWAFIEWPSVIMPLLTHDVCHINIDYSDNLTQRILEFKIVKKL